MVTRQGEVNKLVESVPWRYPNLNQALSFFASTHYFYTFKLLQSPQHKGAKCFTTANAEVLALPRLVPPGVLHVAPKSQSNMTTGVLAGLAGVISKM